MNMNMNSSKGYYEEKYLKYKNKYLELKKIKQIGGGNCGNCGISLNITDTRCGKCGFFVTSFPVGGPPSLPYNPSLSSSSATSYSGGFPVGGPPSLPYNPSLSSSSATSYSGGFPVGGPSSLPYNPSLSSSSATSYSGGLSSGGFNCMNCNQVISGYPCRHCSFIKCDECGAIISDYPCSNCRTRCEICSASKENINDPCLTCGNFYCRFCSRLIKEYPCMHCHESLAKTVFEELPSSNTKQSVSNWVANIVWGTTGPTRSVSGSLYTKSVAGGPETKRYFEKNIGLQLVSYRDAHLYTLFKNRNLAFGHFLVRELVSSYNDAIHPHYYSGVESSKSSAIGNELIMTPIQFKTYIDFCANTRVFVLRLLFVQNPHCDSISIIELLLNKNLKTCVLDGANIIPKICTADGLDYHVGASNAAKKLYASVYNNENKIIFIMVVNETNFDYLFDNYGGNISRSFGSFGCKAFFMRTQNKNYFLIILSNDNINDNEQDDRVAAEIALLIDRLGYNCTLYSSDNMEKHKGPFNISATFGREILAKNHQPHNTDLNYSKLKSEELASEIITKKVVPLLPERFDVGMSISCSYDATDVPLIMSALNGDSDNLLKMVENGHKYCCDSFKQQIFAEDSEVKWNDSNLSFSLSLLQRSACSSEAICGCTGFKREDSSTNSSSTNSSSTNEYLDNMDELCINCGCAAGYHSLEKM